MMIRWRGGRGRGRRGVDDTLDEADDGEHDTDSMIDEWTNR